VLRYEDNYGGLLFFYLMVGSAFLGVLFALLPVLVWVAAWASRCITSWVSPSWRFDEEEKEAPHTPPQESWQAAC
jgi:hypothetical protein